MDRIEPKSRLRKALSRRQQISLEVVSFREAVAKKAYELYQLRGQSAGDDQADWFEAERIISARSQ